MSAEVGYRAVVYWSMLLEIVRLCMLESVANEEGGNEDSDLEFFYRGASSIASDLQAGVNRDNAGRPHLQHIYKLKTGDGRFVRVGVAATVHDMDEWDLV